MKNAGSARRVEGRSSRGQPAGLWPWIVKPLAEQGHAHLQNRGTHKPHPPSPGRPSSRVRSRRCPGTARRSRRWVVRSAAGTQLPPACSSCARPLAQVRTCSEHVRMIWGLQRTALGACRLLGSLHAHDLGITTYGLGLRHTLRATRTHLHHTPIPQMGYGGLSSRSLPSTLSSAVHTHLTLDDK